MDIDLSMALVQKERDGKYRILYPSPITKRTKYIWYEGDKYYRTTECHGWQCYIVRFVSITKAVIEYFGSQYIVDVDDAKFILTEPK